MAINKDNNADLGNQTIEGTSPPIALDAEVVVPEYAVTPSAEELDKQLNELLATPVEPETTAAPMSDEELDKQLAALISETAEPADKHAEIDAINAQLDALLNDTSWEEVKDEPPVTAEAVIIPPEAEPAEAVIIPPEQPTETEAPTTAESEQPIILGEPAVATEAVIVPEPEPENIQEQASEPEVVSEPAAANANTESAMNTNAGTSDAESARQMLEQTKKLMEQIQAQAQAAQAAPPVQPVPPVQTADASTEMMRQATLMLEQARLEQQRLQQQRQAAQQYAQMQTLQSALQQPVANAGDYGATREVDRLKNELDGMRELVNRLTLTISQLQGGVPQQQIPLMYAQQQQPRRDSEDREQYKKLESELEHMRREILEKDLRDREKELDRRQKEAESNVKDIKPEMVQMSDAPGNVPVPMTAQSGAVGGEFIPLANGVYYSIKDKQVYVMTPASNAAAASPTIEPKRSAPPPRRAVAKKRPVARRRPGAPLHRRPGGPRRPLRPGRR